MAETRSGLRLAGEDIDQTVPPGPETTVGDWLLFDYAQPRAIRVLKRKSLLKRCASGTDRQEQLTAANIDTLFYRYAL